MFIKLVPILLLILSVTFGSVFRVNWDGPITPVTADFIDRTLSRAEREGGKLYILVLNTPGGLVESTRKIVQRFSSTPVPVVVFVYPAGSRAASAGAIITISADVAVMAPGTNIGAAHPVKMGSSGSEEKDKDVMEEKILQDMLAFVRSIAKEKGRNVKVVERMVKESLSLTADEALKKGVIDLVATDMSELLSKLEGRKIRKSGREVELELKGSQVINLEKNLKEELLTIITNPTVAYLLLMIGFYGIFFELYNPGAVIPGVIGSISLLLGLYGLSMISMSWLGLLLIILGVLLFILELITPTFGALTLGGIIALTLGSIFLIDPESPYGNIPKSVIAGVVLASGLFFSVVGRLGIRAQRRKKLLGKEGMIGMKGYALEDFKNGEGRVFVHGEVWYAESDEEIRKNDKVVVVEVEGLRLKVKRVPSSSSEQKQGS